MTRREEAAIKAPMTSLESATWDAFLREVPAQELYERIRALPMTEEGNRRLRNILLASYGLPVSVPKRFRGAIVVEVMRDWLPRIRALNKERLRRRGLVLALRHATDLTGDRAFRALRPNTKDVSYLVERTKRGPRNVTAYLMLRAGACGVVPIVEPTKEDVDDVVDRLKKRENERKNAVKGRVAARARPV